MSSEQGDRGDRQQTPVPAADEESSSSPCPGCQERAALVLPCGHSLCQACLQLGQGGCTVCYGRDLLDCVVKRLLDSLFQGRPRRRCSGGLGGGGGPGGGEGGVVGELCPLHGEMLTLFCVEDEEALCVACQREEHEEHECCGTEEATADCKRELRSALRPLQEKLEALSSARQTCQDSADHIKSQAERTAELVKEEFEKLHLFLREEEASVTSALKEEEEQKSQKVTDRMDRLTEDIATLAEAIAETEEAMGTDDITFLKNFKRTSERTQCVVQDPEEGPGALLDVAKHLGCLKYRVWDKMQAVVQYTPVTLDPNTADICLSLSDDLTSLRFTEEEEDHQQRHIPDNPERFCYHECVLGREGFASGRHTWDVEVGASSEWALGVARGTVLRKEWFPPSPDRGLWTICHYGGEYRARTTSDTHLVLKKRPQRVRVQLDWDRGRLAFSDCSDNALIYTFKHRFAETVFPYFSNTCKRHPLRILSGKVSVVAE